MLNYIWLGMILLSVIVGSVTGRIDAVTEGAIDAAKSAVTLAIGLIGIMALWLGLMKIAQEAGLIQLLARGIRPITRRLFQEIPEDHPSMGAMVLNISANILGLGNAATPFGIKAMEELQKLNPVKDTATNAMCTFLAINTSSVQILLPATVVGLMGATANQIFLTTIIATSFSTVVGVVAAKSLEKVKIFMMPEEDEAES